MNIKFLAIETRVKSKLNQIFSAFEQSRCRKEPKLEFEDGCIEKQEEPNVSTQFLETQKNQLIGLQLERYWNVLPVFGSDSAKEDFIILEKFLLPPLENARRIEPVVMKEANQFVSFRFGVVQLLDILDFLGGTTSLDSLLRANKTSETNSYFPYKRFDYSEKLNKTQLLPYETFFSKLRYKITLEKTYSDFLCSIDGGLTSKEYLSKLNLKQSPATGQQNYQYLIMISVWQQENTCSFKDILRWYNNLEVIPTLKAMQKIVDFYHKRGFDMVKLGCILPKLANVFFTNQVLQNFFPSGSATRICWTNYVKTLLVDHPLYSQGQLFWTTLFFWTRQTGANPLTELMLVSSTLSLCVKQCRKVCTRA